MELLNILTHLVMFYQIHERKKKVFHSIVFLRFTQNPIFIILYDNKVNPGQFARLLKWISKVNKIYHTNIEDDSKILKNV